MNPMPTMPIPAQPRDFGHPRRHEYRMWLQERAKTPDPEPFLDFWTWLEKHS